MKSKLKLFTLLLSVFILTACSKSYTQEDVDVLTAKISDLEKQNSALQLELEELKSVTTIPAGMSDEIYSYSIKLHTTCSDYMSSKITIEDCYNILHDFMSDIILSDKTQLNPTDSDCIDKMTFIYLTIDKIYEEDFSEYTLEQLTLVLNKAMEQFSETLYVKY